MRVQLIAKKIEGVFEAALVIDGRFTRAVNTQSVADLTAKLVGPFLAAPQEDGAEISVEVTIQTAKDIARSIGNVPSEPHSV